MKWFVMTSTFFMLSGLLSSIVDSTLVKSTWTSSSGMCALMGIGWPEVLLLQMHGSLGNPSLGLYSSLPSLATKNLPVPGLTFFADSGGLCHGEHHAKLLTLTNIPSTSPLGIVLMYSSPLLRTKLLHIVMLLHCSCLSLNPFIEFRIREQLIKF